MKGLAQAITVSTLFCMLLLLFMTARAHATYRGKNGRIAIAMDRGQGPEIYTIQRNGSDLTRITDMDGAALDPDWSPDGMKIVFDVDINITGDPCQIDIMNADGSDVVDITPKRIVANQGCAYNPSFTPDGKRIVFFGKVCKIERQCPMFIRSMNIHGGDQRRILRTWKNRRIKFFVPRVSPDGRTIGFTIEDFTRVDRYKHALYTVRMNGTHLTQLVPYRFNVCECGNDWAPNGMRIVTSDHVGNTPEPPSNLFTIRPDRTGLRYLTHYRAASPDAIVGAGSFSPDGRWIVFKHANTPEERYVMWKVHPDGSHLTRIRRFKFNFFGRDWGARAS